MSDELDWKCIAMHDTARRRGLWYAETDDAIYLRAGREGDDASAVIRKSSDVDIEFGNILNVLETARYAIEMICEDEDLCDIKPRAWDEEDHREMWNLALMKNASARSESES